ncbi:MAG: class I SAM-dependent methyltransferase [Halobacteriovoraceae bacterium]|nr:class I SAM-dependent methyltransferase [Halobacteriovoraceae bacterium]
MDQQIRIIKSYFSTAQHIKEVNDYLFQFSLLNLFSTLNGYPLRNPKIAKRFQKSLLKEVWNTLEWDRKNIASGKYPGSVIKTKSFKEKTLGLISILKDYPSVIKRRKKNDTLLNGPEGFPDYFSRAFHFQSDGYLSQKSAMLYEQQVDILFTGLSDIMRRCFLPYLVSQYSYDRPLDVLEMACGTGKGSELFKEVFPNSSITLNDLSPFYLEFAKEKLGPEFRYLNGEADQLEGLSDNSFDVTFHIFLFHEIPSDKRKSVLEEQVRLTKDDGLIIVCDSLQSKDRPEWKEVLEDFPKRYHEPFYKNYLEDDIEEIANKLGLEIVHKEAVLLTKCLVFKKK